MESLAAALSPRILGFYIRAHFVLGSFLYGNVKICSDIIDKICKVSNFVLFVWSWDI